jgi:glycosyltransferase involved in cell wall biosynthesis
MRVLIATPWFPSRPGEQFGEFVYASALALKRASADVRVLVTRPWVPPHFPIKSSSNADEPLHVQAFEQDFPVAEVRHLSIPRNLLRPISNRLYIAPVSKRIRSIKCEWDFDAILAHTELTASAAIAARLPLPVLTVLHGLNPDRRLDSPAHIRLVRRTLQASARVLLVGEPLREHYSTLAGSAGNFRVIQNGFTWPAELKADREVAFRKPLRIVSVSNLHEGKGIELSLRALAALNLEGLRGWRYEIVGGGYLRDTLRQLVAELRLGDQVTFIGAVPHRDIHACLLEADVFLLPSYREAFGIAYLEAMAAGLYTIGVTGQGPSQFIRSGENGLLLPARDISAIAGALREIFRDPQAAERAARRGRYDVFASFTWEQHARRVMAQLRESCDEMRDKAGRIALP